MRAASWTLSALLLVCGVIAEEELHREKKDISKLQALFGGWKKPYPIVNFEPVQKPVYWVPQSPQPCNCNWRPTTRYAEGVIPAYVVPARPAFVAPPAPPVIPSTPARLAPPPPPVITATAAISDGQPCLHPDGYHYERPAGPPVNA